MNRPASASAALWLRPLWWLLAHRRSDAVRRWSAPTLSGRFSNAIYARAGGEGESVVVLLHGLVATGDGFGSQFDELSRDCTLIFPDLLGFGRSLDTASNEFGIEAHLDALDQLLEDTGAGDRPIVIGAHSMGCALAMHWADRRGAQIQHIVGWGAATYRDASGLDAQLADTGLMARLFANWEQLAKSVASNRTTVELTWGENDPIGDRSFAETLVGVTTNIVSDADHHLPLTHSTLCVDQLRQAL